MKKKQYISWDLADNKNNLFTLLLLRSTVCRFMRDFFLKAHIKMDRTVLSDGLRISRMECDLDKTKGNKFLALF